MVIPAREQTRRLNGRQSTSIPPEVIRLKVHKGNCIAFVQTDPQTWGGFQYDFKDLESYTAWSYSLYALAHLILLIGKVTLQPPDIGLGENQNLYQGLVSLDNLLSNQIPNAFNDALGIAPTYRSGDCIGAYHRYYPEYYKEYRGSAKDASALIASAYLVRGGDQVDYFLSSFRSIMLAYDSKATRRAPRSVLDCYESLFTDELADGRGFLPAMYSTLCHNESLSRDDLGHPDYGTSVEVRPLNPRMQVDSGTSGKIRSRSLETPKTPRVKTDEGHQFSSERFETLSDYLAINERGRGDFISSPLLEVIASGIG